MREVEALFSEPGFFTLSAPSASREKIPPSDGGEHRQITQLARQIARARRGDAAEGRDGLGVNGKGRKTHESQKQKGQKNGFIDPRRWTRAVQTDSQTFIRHALRHTRCNAGLGAP